MAMKNKKRKFKRTKPVETHPVSQLIDEDMLMEYAPIIDLGHDQLLEVLFFFWDGFERSTINFFLVRDTADQIIHNQPLSGNKLSLGVRKLEWVGGQQRIFRSFMEHEKILPTKLEPDLLKFTYKGVPVELRIYENNPCLEALDIVFYGNETFNIPNPFSVFCEKYDL